MFQIIVIGERGWHFHLHGFSGGRAGLPVEGYLFPIYMFWVYCFVKKIKCLDLIYIQFPCRCDSCHVHIFSLRGLRTWEHSSQEVRDPALRWTGVTLQFTILSDPSGAFIEQYDDPRASRLFKQFERRP